ncbi:hypothetical protein [Neobacillus notoginsengisoli]|nr:hypothetical protein [Neobacillus notoginsengisoli]
MLPLDVMDAGIEANVCLFHRYNSFTLPRDATILLAFRQPDLPRILTIQ